MKLPDEIINEIEDYLGGNVIGVEPVDMMGLTAFLRKTISQSIADERARCEELKTLVGDKNWACQKYVEENESLKKKVEELEKKEVDYLLTPKGQLEKENKNLYASIGNLNKQYEHQIDELKKDLALWSSLPNEVIKLKQRIEELENERKYFYDTKKENSELKTQLLKDGNHFVQQDAESMVVLRDYRILTKKYSSLLSVAEKMKEALKKISDYGYTEELDYLKDIYDMAMKALKLWEELK